MRDLANGHRLCSVLLLGAIAASAGCAAAAPPQAAMQVPPRSSGPSTATTEAPEVALPGVDRPAAAEVPRDAPRVTVADGRVLVDGDVVGDVGAILATKRMTRIDGLFERLKTQRESWKTTHPGAAFPGVVAFAFDGDTKAVVVKSAFQTAAFAGYPNALFFVRTPDGIGALPVDALMPGPLAPTRPASAKPGLTGPSIRQGATTVSGRLPPEVIQRIVRMNFGRFRLCYESGLRTDPKLRGRVTVKFVVGPKGDVTSATDAGSTLPNGGSGVTACFAAGFRSLVFPAPEAGDVTVTYPIELAPGD